MGASIDELTNTNEIGPIIARSIFEFLHSKFGSETVEDLKRAGVTMKSAKRHGRVGAHWRARRLWSPARCKSIVVTRSRS